MTSQLWNADVSAILEKMRSTLQAKGSQQLSDLRAYCSQMDKKGEGLLVRREVEACLNFFGLFPTSQDLGTLMRMYGPHKGSTSQLAWQPFLDALEGRLSSTREAIVRKSYDAIVAKCNNRSVEAFADFARFHLHPFALRGITPAETLRCEFASGLTKTLASTGSTAVTHDVFLAYYVTISHAIPSDDDFQSMMQGVWNDDGLKIVRVAPVFGEHKAALLRKLEEKANDTELPRAVLVKALKKFDKHETGSVSESEFVQAIQVFGFQLSPEQVHDTFRRGETDKGGKLRTEWFADYICTN
ncbi:hypothetical protein Ae201684P_020921 [Aphanomyces euteiches]|nr:hypothetical protein Ae201684P_020921 [Aphanomyces euteiches]KAH9153201.1 hypothetical protein AeRB84_004499 [Aphanomyces euteiches]